MMLSVFFAEQDSAMRQIFDFYTPECTSVLDVSFGGGKLSRRLPNVVGVDQDSNTKADIIANSTVLPLKDATFQVGIFDPPYLYGRRRVELKRKKETSWDSDVRTKQQTPEEFVQRVIGTARELFRVLCSEGIAYVKVCDSRFNGHLIPNHILCINAFIDAGFILHDIVVYIRTFTGMFSSAKSAQNAHGYFIIFRKPYIDSGATAATSRRKQRVGVKRA